MRIGELARQVGLRTSALRYYESLGILAPEARISGSRRYGREALNTLKLLLAAQQAGFTLAEARTLLSLLTDRKRGTKRWREMAATKLRELDTTIERLQGARSALADAIDCACAGSAESCMLVARTPPSSERRKRVSPPPARREPR
jgi:MerR family transcriptional regulator, redox-sensitive transcriptional activator SoxR